MLVLRHLEIAVGRPNIDILSFLKSQRLSGKNVDQVCQSAGLKQDIQVLF